MNFFYLFFYQGFPGAAWSYWKRWGLVSGGTYASKQVNCLYLVLVGASQWRNLRFKTGELSLLGISEGLSVEEPTLLNR